MEGHKLLNGPLYKLPWVDFPIMGSIIEKEGPGEGTSSLYADALPMTSWKKILRLLEFHSAQSVSRTSSVLFLFFWYIDHICCNSDS